MQSLCLNELMMSKLPCYCMQANNTNIVGYSALGWYIARQLFAVFNESVPVGVVQSDVPGTPIQDWTSPRAIPMCYTGPPDPNATFTSHLYNGMIHPLLASRLNYAAVAWYQGESNVGAQGPLDGALYYACALPAMIHDWRGSMLNTQTPFFVVELAAYCNEHDESTFRTFCDSNTTTLTAPDYHLPALRVAQAAALHLPHVYMGSAMDLGSLYVLCSCISFCVFGDSVVLGQSRWDLKRDH